MYHKVDIISPSMWWVDVGSFYQQMLALRDRKVVYLDDYDPGDPSHVAITFDGVYHNVLLYAAPILQQLEFPFELFITSELVGKSNEFDVGEPSCRFASEPELKRMVEMGGRLQWHTRTHPKMGAPRTTEEQDRARHELTIPADLRRIDPPGFGWFAYPYGELNRWLRDEVAASFRGAVSCHQGSDTDLHALNRVTAMNDTNLRKKTICVIVVSHNYGEFLTEAIESVLMQSYLPDSILIMDDASSDSTEEIGTSYQNLHPDLIRYVRNESNLGIIDTFNRAVAETTSDYICFLGADNRFQVDYIKQVMGVFAREGDGLGIVYTDFLLFGARAQDEYLLHPPERRGRIFDNLYFEVAFPEFSRDSFLSGSFIHGSAAYSRAAYDAVGGYQPHGRRPEDANLFKRMIRAGYVAKKAKNTWLEYRQHSSDQANVAARARGQVEFYRIYAKRLEMKVKILERSFGVLSPLVRLASVAEKVAFGLALRMARWWRRTF